LPFKLLISLKMHLVSSLETTIKIESKANCVVTTNDNENLKWVVKAEVQVKSRPSWSA